MRFCNSWRNCAVSCWLSPRRSSVGGPGFCPAVAAPRARPRRRDGGDTHVNRPTAQQQRNTSICGTRFSAISSRAITLIRDTRARPVCAPGAAFHVMCRQRETDHQTLFKRLDVNIRSAFFNASASMALISLMIGASSSLSRDLPFPAVLQRE